MSDLEQVNKEIGVLKSRIASLEAGKYLSVYSIFYDS